MDINKYIGQREIAIWGTDREAADICYRLYKKGISVRCFFDNNITAEYRFLNKKVIKPSKDIVELYYVIITCKNETYISIAKQLKEYGLEEIRDFVYYDCLEKRIALINGNCHMDIVRQYLSQVSDFRKEYAIYPNPLIYMNGFGYIEDEVLKNCDLLITQDIREDNKYGKELSEPYLKAKLKEDARCIVVPNLFGLGTAFFPIAELNNQNCSLRCAQNYNGMFPRKIALIEELFDKGVKEEEIIATLKSQNLLSEKFIIENFRKYMDKVLKRDQYCDVKLYDYIMKHYKYLQMFYDQGHPTNHIIKEIVRQILELLDIDGEIIDDQVSCLDSYEEPILPCVKTCLGLEYNCENIRKSLFAYKLNYFMDLDEYVREYIFWWQNSKNIE